MSDDKFKKESTHVITELYAFISTDVDGAEGVMCLYGQNGGVFPLIGSDMKRINSLRGVAETTAERYGRKLTLAKFTNRINLSTGHMKGLSKERGQWK